MSEFSLAVDLAFIIFNIPLYVSLGKAFVKYLRKKQNENEKE